MMSMPTGPEEGQGKEVVVARSGRGVCEGASMPCCNIHPIEETQPEASVCKGEELGQPESPVGLEHEQGSRAGTEAIAG